MLTIPTVVLRRFCSVAMVKETLPVTDDDADAYALASAQRLRDMARRIRLIAQLAVSERTCRVLQTMAQQYETLAARLDSRDSSDSKP